LATNATIVDSGVPASSDSAELGAGVAAVVPDVTVDRIGAGAVRIVTDVAPVGDWCALDRHPARTPAVAIAPNEKKARRLMDDGNDMARSMRGTPTNRLGVCCEFLVSCSPGPPPMPTWVFAARESLFSPGSRENNANPGMHATGCEFPGCGAGELACEVMVLQDLLSLSSSCVEKRQISMMLKCALGCVSDELALMIEKRSVKGSLRRQPPTGRFRQGVEASLGVGERLFATRKIPAGLSNLGTCVLGQTGLHPVPGFNTRLKRPVRYRVHRRRPPLVEPHLVALHTLTVVL
jgi:hypothetical protein